MELLTSLNTKMEEGPMVDAEAAQVGVDICGALTACEAYELIHRDIKPANIFVDRWGHYKLGDFGTARAQGSGSNMTQKAGTELYMAPEVLRGGHYDKRVDIYSLGLVLYQLTNGNRLPFYPAPEEITQRVMEAAWEKRMRGDELPPPEHAGTALAQVILRACAYKPEDRYESAQAFSNALQEALSMKAAPVPQPAEPSEADAQQKAVDNLRRAFPGVDVGQLLSQLTMSASAQAAPAAQPAATISVPAHTQDAEALYRQAVQYEKGDGVTRDLKKALELYKQAAEQGNAEAQYYLGRFYNWGHGVTKDWAEAVKWYKKASDVDATYYLGMCYYNGDGVPKDEKLAHDYLRKAADNGNTDAAEFLKKHMKLGKLC